MKIWFVLPLALFISTFLYSKDTKNLIEKGKPNGEIIISQNPERSVRLAAADLQTYLEKISGAKLPIRNEPSGKMPYTLFVGDSAHTKALKLSSEGLQYGAFKIASGKDWMAFLGDNTDFVPKEPWAKNNSDRTTGKFQKAWEAASSVRYS